MPDLIRFATKRFEGLRPPFLLLDVVRTLARVRGISEIFGVSARNQFKGHAKSGYADSVKFSCDAFWLETGATLRPEGNWRVPSTPPQPDLEDVPSRKRAMYRRRIALMGGSRDSIAHRPSDSCAVEHGTEGRQPLAAALDA